ncbi:MAG: peptidylprolyl isomerase [Pirellulaceae bacterium]|nr:peptidylprolyl isomerase [Planctomycetales bacterium]
MSFVCQHVTQSACGARLGRIARRWAGAFLAVVCLTGVVSVPVQAQTQPSVGDPRPNADTISVVAVVNGESINREQLAQECRARYGVDALRALVARLLIFNENQRLGIVITEADVDNHIGQTAQQFGLTATQYAKMLEEERGIPTERLRQMTWMDISLTQIASRDIQVDEQEVANRVESLVGPRVQVRMISMLDRRQAEEVLQLARANPDDFGRLAKEYSADRISAASLGAVAPIRRHLGNPEFEDAVFLLKEGEISEVIEVANQFVVVQCVKHLPGHDLTPAQLQQVEAGVRGELMQDQMQLASKTLLESLEARAEIVNVFNTPDLAQQMPGVAALVNGERITMRDLSEECISRFGEEVLQGEVHRMLLLQALKQRNLSVTEADLQAEIERAAIAERFVRADGTADVDGWLADVMETEGATVDLYVRDAVWPSCALKKLVGESISISEEDIQKAFEANYGPRVEVLAIVMQDQRTAQRVWAKVTENPTDEFFGQVASEYSEEPVSRANFGAVPPIAQHGGRPELETVAFSLQPGEISGLTNVGSSWVILKCLGHTEPVVRDVADVREQLIEFLHEQKLRVAMGREFERLYSSAWIDNFLAGTTQTPSTPQVGRNPENLPFRSQNR